MQLVYFLDLIFSSLPLLLFSLKVFQEITSPRCPVIGKGPMMRAPAPAVVVQMRTSETQPLQSLKNRKKENLLPPSRRKTPNSLAKPLLSYPLVLKGNVSKDKAHYQVVFQMVEHFCWFYRAVALVQKYFVITFICT